MSSTTDDTVERGTQDHPNLSIAQPIPCFVNPLGATTDFTQEDMLDGPSCGDAMRPEGGSRSGGNSSWVWDCDAYCFSIVSMVTYAE